MLSPICFTNYSQFEQLKKKEKNLIGPEKIFFSVCQLQQITNIRKKIVDSEFVTALHIF